MARTLSISLFVTVWLILTGCDRSTQEKAREREAQAEQKIRKLGREAKQQVQEADRDIARTVQPESHQAANKLDNAALLTKIKAKLASDVGLATLNSVSIDTRGSVVTLSGTVANAEQREKAQQSASQVSGVTRVVNNLKVAP